MPVSFADKQIHVPLFVDSDARKPLLNSNTENCSQKSISPSATPNTKIKKQPRTPMSMDKWVIRTPPMKNDFTPKSHSAKNVSKKLTLGKKRCKAVKRLDIQMSGNKSSNFREVTKPFATIEDYFKLSPNK